MTTATISVATAQGWQQMPVMHKNGALQVVQVYTLDPDVVFYNTVHDNGLRLPKTDTDVLSDAILICDWCAQNFLEFAKEDLNIANVSESRKEQFNDQLYNFRFITLRDWEDNEDFPF